MTGSSHSIDIDYDALSRQITDLENLAADLNPAIEAGESTQGLDAAHAFGLLCAGMNVPANLVSSYVTNAMAQTQTLLESISQRERSGLKDFQLLDEQIQELADGGMAAIDDVAGPAL